MAQTGSESGSADRSAAVPTLHTLFSAAGGMAMDLFGVERAQSAMLAFATAWIAKTNGDAAAAEQVYAQADGLVSRKARGH